MSINHQSPASSLPPFTQKTVNTTTWGGGGNTSTILDTYISANSIVLVQVTGSVPQSGQWAYAVTPGQVVITSSDSESSSLPISYIIL